jgi:choline kinase
MDAVILASGIGSRMGAKFKNKPKCLTNILNEKTILDLLIEQLKDIKKIFIVVGFNKIKIINHIKNKYDIKKFIFLYNPSYKSKGNYFSVLATKKYIKNSFVLLDADIILPRNSIKKLITNDKKNLVMTNPKNIFDSDDVIVSVNKEGIIKNVKVKPNIKSLKDKKLYSCSGAIKISKTAAVSFFKLLNLLDGRGKHKSYYENAYNSLFLKHRFYVVSNSISRLEVDTLDDLKKIFLVKNFKKKYV